MNDPKLVKAVEALTDLHMALAQGPPVPVKDIRRIATEALDVLPTEESCPRWAILDRCDKARAAITALINECRRIETIEGTEAWFEPGGFVPWTDLDQGDIKAARNAILDEVRPRQPEWMTQLHESGDSGDTFGDSQKKTKKPVRRTKVEHCDCERIYQEAKQKGFPLTLTQVVADYLDDNPNCKLTAQALLRGWKEHRRMLRGGDNLGTV